MFVLISQSSAIMGGIGSKGRSLGQILVRSCLPFKGKNIDAVFLKVVQNV